MKKNSFASIDKSFSFSPKNEYKLAAERSEAASPDLKNSNWRCVFENIRTDFATDWLGGRKGKDRTPFPPASPKSGSEKNDSKFFFGG